MKCTDRDAKGYSTAFFYFPAPANQNKFIKAGRKPGSEREGLTPQLFEFGEWPAYLFTSTANT
jgi:hypothetical protein